MTWFLSTIWSVMADLCVVVSDSFRLALVMTLLQTFCTSALCSSKWVPNFLPVSLQCIIFHNSYKGTHIVHRFQRLQTDQCWRSQLIGIYPHHHIFHLQREDLPTLIIWHIVLCSEVDRPYKPSWQVVSWECKGSISHFATFYMLLICIIDLFMMCI